MRRIYTNNSRNRRYRPASVSLSLTALLLALTVLLGAGSAAAGVQTSARSAALGGAYTALAMGADAGKYNPANLGLTDYRQSGMELIGLGVNLSNNAFTLSDYNKYSGAFLTDDDKDYILSRIPGDGLDLVADVEVTAMSTSSGPYALTITGVGMADINLSRDIFDLVLNGNTFADTIDVTGSHSDMYSYASVGLSYGMPVYSSGTRQLAVGATFKYLQGFAIEEVVELEGMAATFATGLQGEGHLIARTATGGKGYGLDVGAALRLNSHYTVGARIENVFGSITWNRKTEEHGYMFSFDTMTVDNMEDDYVVSDDYTHGIGSFTTTLPQVLNVGFAHTNSKLIWAIDWQQALTNKPGVSTRAQISLGVEYSLVSFLPVRAGFVTGGNHNTAFSFGSGFDFGVYYLDYAVATGSGFSGYSSKGANISLSMGLRF